MNRIHVTPSNVVSVGYDPGTQTLEVEFKNGYVYQYFDVPETIYDSMLNAESAGEFLINNIKGVYRYARV
ncbi:MAG: KTSC domain-containing protein [Candidatus Aminicenantes bacterium]|nr:KTSC domain-containing protein [Candidatus Aminicenantes bacterium]NIM80112.1 KTSC domain-containing protein [Candidatus Aminicenantes bacterium]NIN19450.1 KTSC domain-containing protein [Candidatus Aminicenantes bacterium]NIN43349.1 KTSC domain-containing protein [Candidatus Aminicenantes bacterium]NIN86094.1 KTSC domain-containing protein [Candidatus Aminicenantes bacterium]